MKIIVSHDVDHITVWEHNKDLIVPKFFIRALLELGTGKISFTEFGSRFNDALKNKWQCLDELMTFNKQHNVHSTFFVGVNNGLGLAYSLRDAEHWIQRIILNGFEVGVHGIDFDDFNNVMREHNLFLNLSKQKTAGIRMHYLRNNDHTMDFLQKSGYVFDATKQGMSNPYKIDLMWEFPLQLMEAWVIIGSKRRQIYSLSEAKERTLRIIDEAMKNELSFFSLLFHDRYFSESFVTWRDWYIWVIEYFVQNKMQFVNYSEAVSIMEQDSLKC